MLPISIIAQDGSMCMYNKANISTLVAQLVNFNHMYFLVKKISEDMKP